MQVGVAVVQLPPLPVTEKPPPVLPVFVAFRVMVGVGLAMLATSWIGWNMLRRRGWNAHAMPRRFLRLLAAMTFSGWVATVAGWYVSEVGRQPFLVYGYLRTAEAAEGHADQSGDHPPRQRERLRALALTPDLPRTDPGDE